MTSASVESVDGGDSGLAENHRIELLDLPDMAIENVMRHLDLHGLKKLRLVSKLTKGWVEQKEFLQKFKINISSVEMQEELTNSTEVPWNSFEITLRKDTAFEDINSDFADKFGPFIKHLVVNNESWINTSHNIFLSLIVNPTMETLCIKKLILEKDWLCGGAGIWTRNLKKLKKLKIEESPVFVLLNPDEISKARVLFDKLLQSCPNLTHLHLPTLTFTHKISYCRRAYFAEDHHVNSIELHYEIVLSPLLNYLNRIDKSGSRVHLTVDLNGFEDRERFRRGIFPLSLEGLLELSTICGKTGTKLHNVTSRAFTNDTNDRYVNMNMDTFKDVISSVKILRNPSGLHGIFLPPSLKIYVEIRGNVVDYSSFELQHPVHSVNLYSNSSTIQTNLYLNLFQVVRPSVKEFKCDWFIGDRWGQGNFQTIWTGIDICTSFPNLRSLHLHRWGNFLRKSDFGVLLTGLPLLERLCLKNSIMNEEGLLGPDPNNPLILLLQNLVHLEFIDTNITDLHLTKAFRHMRLKTFVLKRETPLLGFRYCSVTFQNGISTLCSIDGGFGDTIKHFEISIPHDSTKEEMDVYVNQFKNLKTYKTFQHCPQSQMSGS